MKNSRKFWYNVFVVCTLLIEIILLALITMCLIGVFNTTYLLITNKSCDNYSGLATRFGAYLGGSLVPISGVVVTILFEHSHLFQQIENDLAKCANLYAEIKRLPDGAGVWFYNELNMAIEKEKPHLDKESMKRLSSNILDYDFEIDIFLRQELSELYHVTLCDLSIYGEGKSPLYLREKDKIAYAPANTRDLSGVAQSIDGEKICVYINKNISGLEDEPVGSIANKSKMRIEDLKDEKVLKKSLVFSLNFQKNDNFTKKFIPFLIFRNLVRFTLLCSLRRRQVRIKLDCNLERKDYSNSIIEIRDGIVSKLKIDNITMSIERNLKWSKYLAKAYKIEKENNK